MTQGEALDILKLGSNVFLTGAAGSGKTYLLNQYITHLRAHGVGVAMTASTGIAATHIGGQTIHSWSGVGVREDLSDDEVEDIAGRDRVRRSVSSASVLVIDEVSMLHAHTLDAVERIVRAVRGGSAPFGGMQVVLCGDFFQLPPVMRSGQEYGGGEEIARFAYECAAWEQGNFQICYLEEQFRQSAANDPLLSVLNAIRSGTAGEPEKAHLRTRWRKEPEGETRPTRLYPHNANVDSINAVELERLSGAARVFEMKTRGFKALAEGLERSCLAPRELRLKEGAQVMFVKNAPTGAYVNGTRGVVESFAQEGGWPVIRTASGRRIVATPEEWRLEEGGVVRAALTQVPLRLAWAVTIHKSQGMTLDAAEVDLSGAFEPGMGYVALSRVRSLGGLKLLGFNETALMVHPKVLAHDAKFREWSQAAREALARFGNDAVQRAHEEVLFKRFGGVQGDALAGTKTCTAKARAHKESTYDATLALLRQNLSLQDIVRQRKLTVGTIISHLEKLKGDDMLPNIEHLRPAPSDLSAITAAFKKAKTHSLAPVFGVLKGKYSFEDIRLARLFLE